MRDHAAIIPTSVGPIGAIVSVPDDRPRRAAIALQGGGPPCRAGVNGGWAQQARELAARGIATLRFDFAWEGESTIAGEDVRRELGWRRTMDPTILREAAAWFLERLGLPELLLIGSCYGGRLALDFAAEQTDSEIVAAFLVVPYLWNVPPNLKPDKQSARQEPFTQAEKQFDRAHSDVRLQREAVGEVEAVTDTLPLESSVVDACRAALNACPIRILIGEGDSQKPIELKSRLGETSGRLEIEVVPNMIIHPATQPHVQAFVFERTLQWIAET
jgi:predicted alpha/beta-hydrolase family hydrolase